MVFEFDDRGDLFDVDLKFHRMLDQKDVDGTAISQIVAVIDDPFQFEPKVLDYLATRLMLLGDLRSTIVVGIDEADLDQLDSLSDGTAFGALVADLPRVHLLAG